MRSVVFAHRGARSLAPENTLPAIEKAWRLGAAGAEVDVRASLDEELFLFHDATPGRTTNIAEWYPSRTSQPIETFSFAELNRLNAGSWFIESDPFGQIRSGAVADSVLESLRNCPIPRLVELFAWIKNKKWRVNLEIKPRPASLPHFPIAEAVVRLLETEQVAPEKIIISSFDHHYLRIIQALRPDLEINALIGSDPKIGNDWGRFEFRIYNANSAFIDLSQLRSAQRHGCRVNLYTVNDREQMKRFSSWGVHTIITDFPQIMLESHEDER